MKKGLQILLVGYNANDAERIGAALSQGGLTARWQQVETRTDFLHAVKHQHPDVIISDHGSPILDGFTALALTKERCPEVPFIFVSGALGEQVAIESFKQGATDYVLKEHLEDLVPAFERALGRAEERAQHKRAESERDQLLQELQEALVRIKTLSGLLPICTLCKKIRHHVDGWQPLEVYLEEHTDAIMTRELCPECIQKISPAAVASLPFYPNAMPPVVGR